MELLKGVGGINEESPLGVPLGFGSAHAMEHVAATHQRCVARGQLGWQADVFEPFDCVVAL